MMRTILIQLIILNILIASGHTYGNRQIVKILDEYFLSSKGAPDLIGHRFYESSSEMVFQLEIETDSTKVNGALVFSFDAINKFADLSKTNFTHSILVIHFYGDVLPIVAETNINCARRFFIDELENENQWRKNCLTIKNY